MSRLAEQVKWASKNTAEFAKNLQSIESQIIQDNPISHAFLAQRYPIPSLVASGAFQGLTFGAKENFQCSGETSCLGLAKPVLASALCDADLISKCKSLGATFLGRLNLDPLAATYSGENCSHGDVLNSLYPEFSPLGSSSGAAVAVATRMINFALVSDLGGSARLPASALGVCGLKTSVDTLSGRGCFLIDSTLDVPGLIALEIEDLVFILETLLEKKARTQSTFKLLVPSPQILQQISPQISSDFKRSLELLAADYSIVSADDWIFSDQVLLAYIRLAALGYKAKMTETQIADEILPDSVKALRLLASRISTQEFQEAQIIRKRVCDYFTTLSDSNSVVLSPALPWPVPKRIQMKNFETSNFRRLNFFLWQSNLAAAPAIVFPIAQAKDAPPFSLQLCGAPATDLELCLVAAKIQSHLLIPR